MLARLKKWIKDYRKGPEQVYLENSVDLVDLERRQRNIIRGTAPFQTHYTVEHYR